MVRRIVVFLACMAATAGAEVKLPAIISDHMVIQGGARPVTLTIPAGAADLRKGDVRVPIWGWAAPGEQVTVTIAGQTKTAMPGEGGKWKVELDPIPPSDKPLTMTVKGSNTITVSDILVGEVWLGSGQSNMAFIVRNVQDAAREIAEADYPRMRFFTVDAAASPTAQADCKGKWELISPGTVDRCSATCYFFGREIHKQLKLPVGLINSSVGGTPIESWIRSEAQHATPELAGFFKPADAQKDSKLAAAAKAQYEKELSEWKKAAAKAKAEKKKAPRAPRDPSAVARRKGDVGGLYNGKINPLIPYAIRGFLWYQGEANTVPEKAPYYQHQLPLLVSDWRKQWGAGDLPFAWVQLPNFNGKGRNLPVVREAMLKTLKLPATGMAITIDIGMDDDIHPKNKQEVGRRLAMWAMSTIYGKGGPSIGPVPARHEIKGNAIVVKFDHAQGLAARGGEIKGFQIAGADRKFVPAQAVINGVEVAISAQGVAQPQAVRYAWANIPVFSLVNGAGIPASPFRTDDWAADPE